MDQSKIKEAYDTLVQAMIDDGEEEGGYAHSWFCNIKMPIYDVLNNRTDLEIDDELLRRMSAEAANNIMRLLFQIRSKYE